MCRLRRMNYILLVRQVSWDMVQVNNMVFMDVRILTLEFRVKFPVVSREDLSLDVRKLLIRRVNVVACILLLIYRSWVLLVLVLRHLRRLKRVTFRTINRRKMRIILVIRRLLLALILS